MTTAPVHSKQFVFGGISFHVGNMESVISIVDKWVRRQRKTYICVTGVHGVSESMWDRRVFLAHASAGLVVPDGTPIVWAGRRVGHEVIRRIYGPDLFLELCRYASEHHKGIFLYGTTIHTLEKLVFALKKKFPDLLISGVYAPPFSQAYQQEKKEIVRKINRSGASIVFVGLGTPKQELWMFTHRDNLHATLLVGVGAAFDFVSGVKAQAPVWIRSAGLEWIYRIYQEPVRLWKRYVSSGVTFLCLLFREMARAIMGNHI